MADSTDEDLYENAPAVVPSLISQNQQPVTQDQEPSDADIQQYLAEKSHPGIGQQALAGAEAVGQGVLGPLAPAAEEATGLTTGSDIRARATAYPITHGVGETAGLVGSMFIPGLQENSLAGLAGNIGEHAAGLLPKAAGILPKIVETGVKASAEMATLATSDEFSKMVTGDPDQTIGSAAMNISLAGIMGLAGGAVLGGVSPLWDKTKNVLGVEKLISDYMGETKAIREIGKDPVTAATQELRDRISSVDNMSDQLRNTKPELIANAMPEATPENAATIDSQMQDIANKLQGTIENASASIKTKNAVPYLQEDLNNFQKIILDENSSFADKYNAANELKRTMDGYANWETKFGASEETTAKGALGRTLGNYIRPLLEDTDVWGAAGKVQQVTNESISNMIKATKDIKSQLLSKTMGELDVAPEKVQTLLNQTNVGKAGRKASVLANYLDATNDLSEAIKQVHLDNGLEVPMATRLNPTPVIDHALNTEVTPGVALARYTNRRGAAIIGRAVGEAGAGAVGGGLGALVGHPIVGAWMGEKVLTPFFSALAKPLAETAMDAAAAKASMNYLGDAYKGQQLMKNSLSNVFRQGAEVVGKDLIPDQESRDKLDKSLTAFQNPQNAMQVGGKIGHYLPQHATAASTTAATAANYLAALKPTQPTTSPLDTTPPIDKQAQTKYNRALDIAQQPLMALKYMKEGTLLPQDVQTLKTIYPSTHSAMVQGLVQNLIDHKASGGQVPYSQRVAMNLFMNATPLDGTMTPMAAQAIMGSASPQQMQNSQATQSGSKKGGASKATLAQMDKVSSLYQTPLQARAADKKT